MRVLFVGGGTLGSVTPLLAVAEELKRKLQIANCKLQMTFWGTRTGPERQLVEAAGIPFHSIPAGKLRRYWDTRNFVDFVVLKWAFWIALIRLIRWRPSVVVGVGSFVQVPVMWAAWLLRIPIVIHQLDVRPSLANRLVAPFATRITVTFPTSAKSFHHAEVVGVPVRAAILAARDINSREAKRLFGFTGDRPVLLVLGGGTGAQAINELVWGALAEIMEVADVIHVMGLGKGGTFECCESHPNASNTHDIRSIRIRHSKHSNVPYRSFDLLTDDLPSAYAAADLVISRAGMGTIAELAALGKPMVLIPIPETHQEENAAALAAAGGAVVWDQRELPGEQFVENVRALIQNTERRCQLASAASAVFPTEAAARFARVISNLCV